MEPVRRLFSCLSGKLNLLLNLLSRYYYYILVRLRSEFINFWQKTSQRRLEGFLKTKAYIYEFSTIIPLVNCLNNFIVVLVSANNVWKNRYGYKSFYFYLFIVHNNNKLCIYTHFSIYSTSLKNTFYLAE